MSKNYNWLMLVYFFSGFPMRLFNHFAQAAMPSPVVQETLKISALALIFFTVLVKRRGAEWSVVEELNSA